MKIDSFVQFPLEGLDMSQYCVRKFGKDELIYDCYAISNHYGTMSQGHYTAFAKNQGEWMSYNDGECKKVEDPS